MFYIKKEFIILLILNSVIVTVLFYSTQKTKISYYQGLSLFQQGQYEKSIPYFENAADKSEAFPELFKYLGFSMQWTGRYEPAMDYLNRYLLLKPDSFEAHKAKAQIHAWKKEYGAAVEVYEKALRLQKDEETQKELAQVYSWSGNYDKAEEIYRSLLLKRPDDPTLYYSLSELLNWKQLPQDAMAFIKKGMEFSKGKNMLLLYAEILFNSGEYLKAKEILNTLIDHDPSNDKAKLILGKVLVCLKEYSKAISLYQEQMEKSPLSVSKELASAYYYDSKFFKSIPLLQEYLKSSPGDLEAKLMLANAFRFTGRIQEAITCYEALLPDSLERGGRQTFDGLGEAYIQKGDLKSAADLFEKTLLKEPENIPIRLKLGEIQGWIKKYSEAIGNFQKVLSFDPENREAKEKMARVLKWNKEYKKAEVLFKDVLKQDPSRIYLYTELAELLIWDNRSREALPLLISMKNYSQDKESYEFLLAQALYNSGDFSGSKEVYLKILQSFPNDRKAKQGLADSYAYGKEYEKAIVLYNELLTLAPDMEIKKQLALVLSWAGRYADSITLITEILKFKPEDTKTKLLLARNYMYSGQAAKAIPILKELEKLNLEGETSG